MSWASRSGVSWSSGNPMRWRPEPSSSTTLAECSKPCPLGLDPVVAPHGRKLRPAAEQEAHPPGH